MKIPAKSLTRLILGTVAGISVASLLLPQSSWAETPRVEPLQDFDSEQNTDPFSSKDDGNGFGGVFDLMHRAQMGSMLNSDELSNQQNENLDAAAAQFRARQRQRLQGQQQATPANPATTPQVAN